VGGWGGLGGGEVDVRVGNGERGREEGRVGWRGMPMMKGEKREMGGEGGGGGWGGRRR